jgi:hypothetical protein
MIVKASLNITKTVLFIRQHHDFVKSWLKICGLPTCRIDWASIYAANI